MRCSGETTVWRLRLMWSQDQNELPLSVDSHDWPFCANNCCKTVSEDSARGWIRAAVSLFGNLAERVDAVPQGAPVPPTIRRQSPHFVERSRGGTDNTHGGVVGDDGIIDTSASAVSRWVGFGQRIGEDRLDSVEDSADVWGHSES